MDENLTEGFEEQIGFPLYAASKEVIRLYKPLIDELDLTYTQYIVLQVMWEEDQINVSGLGERLYLDSGTLTPVLKKLENKGYIKRERSHTDERNLIVTLTDSGRNLKQKTAGIHAEINKTVALSETEVLTLRSLLGKILNNIYGNR